MTDNARPDADANQHRTRGPDTDAQGGAAARDARPAPPADRERAGQSPPHAAAPDGAEGKPRKPGGDAQESVKETAATAGEEYAERDRAGVTSVYYFDNRRSYGVYAEGKITAREIAGHDKTVTSGDKPSSAETARAVSVVAVASRERERLATVTVSAGNRNRAAVVLDRERLVILHGPPGVGKATVGLWLLGLDHEVLSVDPSLTARDLTEFSRHFPYGKQRRYLVEALPAATIAQLSGFVVRAATRDLEDRDSYLVITVDDRIPLSPELAGYVVPWPDRPDAALALRAHLTYYLGGDEAAAAESRYDLTQLNAGLSGRPVRSVDEVAHIVADGFRASQPLDSLLDDLGFGAPARVAEWFAVEERTPADLGFLLAAAVLGGCPYLTVSRHARRLEKLIADACRIRLKRQPDNPLRPRSQLLKETMAVLKPGYVETEYGQSPAEIVELENRWLVQAVLSTVWAEYDLLAGALLRWLQETGDDPEPGVRIRTASAAGWLSQYEFAALRRQLFVPWARGSSNAARAAADALGLAAWQDSTAPLVLALLSVWARNDRDYDLWWTAAVAYGGEVGVRYQGVAMDHLLIIAGNADDRAAHVVAHSVVRLVASGGRFAPEVASFVLAHLTNWLTDSQEAALTALSAYAEMLRRASDANWPSSREYWQLLTAPASLPGSADLLRAVLNERAFRTWALDSIEILTRAGDYDDHIRHDLLALLTRVAGGGDNDRGRLVHYLSRWAGGSDPSPAARDLADQLKEETVS
jgi:hypothetical protein